MICCNRRTSKPSPDIRERSFAAGAWKANSIALRLAKACKISRTQLFKKLIQGADLKAIPPAEIYEIAKDLSAIREFILEYCLEGEPVRAYVAAIESMMNTFFEHCKMFYDEGIFGAAFEKYYHDLDESEAT